MYEIINNQLTEKNNVTTKNRISPACGTATTCRCRKYQKQQKILQSGEMLSGFHQPSGLKPVQRGLLQLHQGPVGEKENEENHLHRFQRLRRYAGKNCRQVSRRQTIQRTEQKSSVTTIRRNITALERGPFFCLFSMGYALPPKGVPL